MKLSLSFHGVTEPSRPGLRDLFRERARHIERRLASYQPDVIRIDGRVAKNPHHHLYRVCLRLKLPRAALVAATEGHDLRTVLFDAFNELERRTTRHVARLRCLPLWKIAQRRLPLGRFAPAAMALYG
ncbi:MAG TPA: HPF/RaiA family ribosome-associated protein [Steroidobacteraceae bacterium]|nr:HPF/RaiA family ribosome-associated protein [Steroidobacteraceae bacterium]